ncbi:MAG: WYL domain-containing protein, partial [Methylacidiphilales bacterium]|nr:WYL domain-containing protein [Candidatus Methylacidiphilales bacterium]
MAILPCHILTLASSCDKMMIQAMMNQARLDFQYCADCRSGCLWLRRASRRPIRLKQVSPNCGGSRSLRPTDTVFFAVCGGVAADGDISADLEKLRLHYTFVPPPLTKTNAQTLLTVHRAIREQRLLFISYFANTTGQRGERVVEPYHLSNIRGNWYLLAYDVGKSAKRIFQVGRIQACHVLPEKFVRRSTISIPNGLKSSFGAEGGDEPVEVVIRFDKYQAPWIRERKWHDTAKLEQSEDGS